MLEIPIEIAAYAAGFFDGEGNIDLQYDRKNAGGAWLCRAMITNTNRDILEFISRFYGGTMHSQDQRASWKIVHRLVFHGDDLLDFLRSIRPYVQLKRDAIEAGILFAETKKDRSKNEYLSEAERALRFKLVDEVRLLNRRGKESQLNEEEVNGFAH